MWRDSPFWRLNPEVEYKVKKRGASLAFTILCRLYLYGIPHESGFLVKIG
jgi:hypothetical protein